MSYCRILFFLLLSVLLQSTSYAAQYAPVAGFARSYIDSKPLADATITVLENGLKLKTNAKGEFGPIMWPVGEPITLIFEKAGFHKTQTGSVIVPPEGLTGPLHNMTLQVPDDLTYYFFTVATGSELNENNCHLVVTITARGKTMDDAPQGEVDAKAVLIPDTGFTPYYFGVFTEGPLKDKTNPFAKGLTLTSADGGVLYANLQPSDKPYLITATKNGVAFTQARFICRKGMFVNISPPQGPSVV